MSFIKKINKYLLEHYPLIWNTRLVWMTVVGMLLHALFFGIGYATVNGQLDIQQEYDLNGFYFGTSIMFFNILLSIIVLLIWVLYYLQNNAFKHLYTIKKNTLFLQFCCVLFIVFVNISQYYSFRGGLKLKIKSLYTWEEVDKDIKEFNKTALFLIQDENKYRIGQKAYPAPFPLEFDRTGNKSFLAKRIDTTKAYFYSGTLYYQFYKIKEDLLQEDIDAGVFERQEYLVGHENLAKTHFKYRDVKDVAAFKDDVVPCLVNYSRFLFDSGQDSIAKAANLKHFEAILQRANEQEIKEQLRAFIQLATKYSIANNLEVANWYHLLNDNNYNYTPVLVKETATKKIYEYTRTEKARKNYPITQFILKSKPTVWDNKEYNFTKKVKTAKKEVTVKDSDTHKYSHKEEVFFSEYNEEAFGAVPYCDIERTSYFFENVHEAYFLSETIWVLYVYIALAFIMSLLLFLFKVTDIKTLLLSFVAGAVVLILSGLTIAFLHSYDYDKILGDDTETIIMFCIGILLIVNSIVALKRGWKKMLTAIGFSLALYAIPVTIVLGFALYFNAFRTEEYYYFESWFSLYGFWVIMLAWLLGVFLYAKVIRSWKALPA